MTATAQERSGGEILIASLLAQGATQAFGVPGESFLAVLDALHDAKERLHFMICRQEGGAAYMAEAYGKLTGTPGLLFVTRGPGACNAAIGIHTAMQDSTPMIVFIGQVGGSMVDREAFQEIDYRQMFGSVVKWATQIDRAERIPEYVAHAYRIALSGRPGPVVLALPEDMLTSLATCEDPPRVTAVPASPGAAEVEKAHALLAKATAPLVIVGGSRWDTYACRALAAWAEANSLPVAAGFRSQDLLDNRNDHYVGDVGIGINPKLAARVRDADVLLVIGERLGEMTTSGYTLLDVPSPRQKVVHVHPSSDELGHVYQPEVAIASTPGEFLDAIAKLPSVANASRREQVRAARADFDAWRSPRPVPGPVDMWQVMLWLDGRLPDDAIVTNGAGNYTVWLHRLYRYRRYRTQLAPYSGAMGYGVPAAVAAKTVHRDRMVLSWNGDGCFLMNGQELATAVQYNLAVIFVVVDNGMYGTIRMHQERHYPARVSGTDLVNPDFAAMARAFGAHGETVLKTEEFAPAFERAVTSGGPALLHVRIDPQALTMSASLDAIREQARKHASGS